MNLCNGHKRHYEVLPGRISSSANSYVGSVLQSYYSAGWEDLQYSWNYFASMPALGSLTSRMYATKAGENQHMFDDLLVRTMNRSCSYTIVPEASVPRLLLKTKSMLCLDSMITWTRDFFKIARLDSSTKQKSCNYFNFSLSQYL